MRLHRTLFAAAAAVAAVAGGLLTAPSAAAAQESAWVKSQVTALLRNNPGAVQVGTDQVRFDRGVTMTVVPARRAADGTGDCRSGWACMWQHRDATGYRLEFYNYGFYDLTYYNMPDGTNWRDQISSYYNHQTGGAWVVGKNWVGAWEWVWGGPGGTYEGLVSANDQVDGIELSP